MMKKIILICLANVLLHSVNGQTFVNNGAVVAVTPGGVMSIKSDNITTGSGSLENLASTTGILRNAGLIQIEGSFVNTSGVADGFGASTGVYRVQGDWENDASFTADSSTVVFYGLSQSIKGMNNGTPNPTTFYNLIDTLPTLAASASSVKTQEVGTNVSNVLTLYSSEHATANYYLNILNPEPTAIVENSYQDAFVSSTGNGRLSWTTNQKAEYIFPTGINENGPKIREVSITPPNTTTRTYSVRFADEVNSPNTTTAEGYDTAQKSGYIGEVNDIYYHLINTGGNTDPADLAIFFDPTVDPHWQSIARWQQVPQWQDLQNTVTIADARGAPRYKIVKSAWIPTTDTAYALVDTIAIKADFAFPTAFIGDCQTCTGTTPSDGNNGVFGIINQADLVTLQDLSVFNRWGEMVFDSKRDGNPNWAGHFNGKLQPQGNYLYRAVVTNNTTGKQYPLVTGNVALLW
jgi:gliding motility-associated-like protein